MQCAQNLYISDNSISHKKKNIRLKFIHIHLEVQVIITLISTSLYSYLNNFHIIKVFYVPTDAQ
jgi:hypothetical protein